MEIRVSKESWLLLILFLGSWGTLQAQYKWKNPQEQVCPVIRGRAWQSELQGTYARLPLKAQSKVRTPLWDLSQQSAGLSVAFYSNSPEIKIKYVAKRNSP